MNEEKGEVERQMIPVVTVSRDELIARRDEILGHHDTTLDEFTTRAHDFRLVGDEWASWNELRDIAFLLGEDDD